MSRSIDSLNEKKVYAYADEMTQIAGGLGGKLVALADKYNVDRDFTIRRFAQIFSFTAQILTFQHHECEAGDDD